MEFSRQTGIVEMRKLSKAQVTVVGVGSVGSFTTLALAKMGVEHIEIFDGDIITDHNIPNQFYRLEEIGRHKVNALHRMIEEFTGVLINISTKYYADQPLKEFVIVCTDSMESRREIWKEFKKQKTAKYLIDSRMGGELGRVFVVYKGDINNMWKYNESLKALGEELPCSERTIIYCVMMIASLICRAVKAIIQKEKEFPRDCMFAMRHMMFMK